MRKQHDNIIIILPLTTLPCYHHFSAALFITNTCSSVRVHGRERALGIRDLITCVLIISSAQQARFSSPVSASAWPSLGRPLRPHAGKATDIPGNSVVRQLGRTAGVEGVVRDSECLAQTDRASEWSRVTTEGCSADGSALSLLFAVQIQVMASVSRSSLARKTK